MVAATAPAGASSRTVAPPSSTASTEPPAGPMSADPARAGIAEPPRRRHHRHRPRRPQAAGKHDHRTTHRAEFIVDSSKPGIANAGFDNSFASVRHAPSTAAAELLGAPLAGPAPAVIGRLPWRPPRPRPGTRSNRPAAATARDRSSAVTARPSNACVSSRCMSGTFGSAIRYRKLRWHHRVGRARPGAWHGSSWPPAARRDALSVAHAWRARRALPRAPELPLVDRDHGFQHVAASSTAISPRFGPVPVARTTPPAPSARLLCTTPRSMSAKLRVDASPCCSHTAATLRAALRAGAVAERTMDVSEVVQAGGEAALCRCADAA